MTPLRCPALFSDMDEVTSRVGEQPGKSGGQATSVLPRMAPHATFFRTAVTDFLQRSVCFFEPVRSLTGSAERAVHSASCPASRTRALVHLRRAMSPARTTTRRLCRRLGGHTAARGLLRDERHVVRVPRHHQLRAARELHAELDPADRHRRAPQHQQQVHRRQSCGSGSSPTTAPPARSPGTRRRRIATAADFATDGKSVDDHAGRPAVGATASRSPRATSSSGSTSSRRTRRSGRATTRARRRTTGPRSRPSTTRTSRSPSTRPTTPQWMLANEFSEITPLPQHVWDKTE